MKYEFNDLLSEEEVTALTAETFSAGKRRRTWRKVVALAACAALVVSIANFGAIAAGVERMFRYIAGVGTVDTERTVWVQAGPVEEQKGDKLYRITNASERDGVVNFNVDTLFYGDGGTDWAVGMDWQLQVVLSAQVDGEYVRCSPWYGEKFDNSGTSFGMVVNIQTVEDEVEYSTTTFGYGDTTDHYAGAQAYAGHTMSFIAPEGAGNTYKVELTAGRGDKYGNKPWGLVGKYTALDLMMKPGRDTPTETHSVETPQGTLNLLVSDAGKTAQLYLVRDPKDTMIATTVWPWNLRFVDQHGNRYAGIPGQSFSGVEGQSQEVHIERAPRGKIVAIELGGYYTTLEDTTRPSSDGERFYHYERKDLDWVIPIE